MGTTRDVSPPSGTALHDGITGSYGLILLRVDRTALSSYSRAPRYARRKISLKTPPAVTSLPRPGQQWLGAIAIGNKARRCPSLPGQGWVLAKLVRDALQRPPHQHPDVAQRLALTLCLLVLSSMKGQLGGRSMNSERGWCQLLRTRLRWGWCHLHRMAVSRARTTVPSMPKVVPRVGSV